MGGRWRAFAARRTAAGFVCAAALLATAGTSVAEEGASAGDDLKGQAVQLYEEGQAAARLGRWEKARTFFLSAWRVQRHWQIAANLGRVELKLGRDRDAAEHLAFALRAATTLSDGERGQIAEPLKAARARVGGVRLAVTPADAETRIDDVPVEGALAGEALFVDPGRHRIELRRTGYRPAEQTVDVAAGQEVSVQLTLTADPPVAAVHPAPPARQAADMPVARRGAPKGALIAGAAVASGGVALGLGLLAASFAEAGARDAGLRRSSCAFTIGGVHHGCSPEVASAEAARVNLGNAAFWSLLGAGAVGAATLTYALAAPPSGEQVKPVVTATAGPGGAAVVLSMKW